MGAPCNGCNGREPILRIRPVSFGAIPVFVDATAIACQVLLPGTYYRDLPSHGNADCILFACWQRHVCTLTGSR